MIHCLFQDTCTLIIWVYALFCDWWFASISITERKIKNIIYVFIMDFKYGSGEFDYIVTALY